MRSIPGSLFSWLTRYAFSEGPDFGLVPTCCAVPLADLPVTRERDHDVTSPPTIGMIIEFARPAGRPSAVTSTGGGDVS